jgi:hypothetical protein
MGRKPLTIPGTKERDFWGDAEIIQCEPEVHTVSQVHSWKQQGAYAFCTVCPVQHGIFIDINKQEVRYGEIVDKETGDVVYGRARKTETPKVAETVDKVD